MFHIHTHTHMEKKEVPVQLVCWQWEDTKIAKEKKHRGKMGTCKLDMKMGQKQTETWSIPAVQPRHGLIRT